MATAPHARYRNPMLGEIHYCPARGTYVKRSDLKDADRCKCGKRIKQNTRGR